MDTTIRNGFITDMERFSESFAETVADLRAFARRAEVLGFEAHLLSGIQVMGTVPNPEYVDAETTPDIAPEIPEGRFLDPNDPEDRATVIPGSRYTLGQVLDMQYAYRVLLNYIAAPGGAAAVEPVGVEYQMYGFTRPESLR